MNCRECRPLLYLNREGELTQPEARALADHLIDCERCAKEKAWIDGASILARGLHCVDLDPRDPEELTRRILDRTSRRTPSYGQQNSNSMMDRFLSLYAAPQVRWASSGFIVLAIGCFLLQCFWMLRDVHDLEAQQQHRVCASRGPHVAYVVDARPLQGTPEGVLLDRMDGLSTDGFLMVNERSAATWRANGRVASLGFARRPLIKGSPETMQTLMSYLVTNAHPLLSFSREGV